MRRWNSAACITADGCSRAPHRTSVAAGGAELVGQILERPESCGVDGGHVAQAHDDDRRQLVDVVRDVRHLVGHAEQERAVDPEHGHVRRDRLVLQDVDAPGLDVVGVTRDTVVVTATRRMNSSAARIIPTSTASVRSANTVRKNVTSHTLMSVLVSFSRRGISCHSPML